MYVRPYGIVVESYTLKKTTVGSDKAFLAVSDSVDGWGF